MFDELRRRSTSCERRSFISRNEVILHIPEACSVAIVIIVEWIGTTKSCSSVESRRTADHSTYEIPSCSEVSRRCRSGWSRRSTQTSSYPSYHIIYDSSQYCLCCIGWRESESTSYIVPDSSKQRYSISETCIYLLIVESLLTLGSRRYYSI